MSEETERGRDDIQDVVALEPLLPPAAGQPAPAQTPALVAAPSFIRGHVDEISDVRVSGWVVDKNEPTRRCMVRLVEGDKTLARVRAAGFRPDLKEAGVGDGEHAFSLPMPRSLIDGRDHLIQVIEEKSGAVLHDLPLSWRSVLGGSPSGRAADARSSEAGAATALPLAARKRTDDAGKTAPAAAARMTLLIDLSDLVYYIGHHDNLTGIQRVQSSIVLAMGNSADFDDVSIVFLSFYSSHRKWIVIPYDFMMTLLSDLFYPKELRRMAFDPQDAKNGLLPGAVDLETSGAIDAKAPSVLCLLGAAWVQRDYFSKVLALKRKFGTKFVMLVHDLIPIYARDTCDQGTAQVFESFFTRAMRHVDQYLCVSENTAKDLRNYLTSQRAKIPPITVTRLGGAFSEFMLGAPPDASGETMVAPERFVLFVSTIEGRKNHKFVFDIWRALIERGEDPPQLLCVGRIGWKAEAFISDLVESNYLDGRVAVWEDISDAQLQALYQDCLFTVFPSVYEGWGLPVGEALAYGKICVCSDRASIPEVAGEFGVYIDIADLEKSVGVVAGLLKDDERRGQIERDIQQRYKPTSWESVAQTVLGTCADASQMKWTEPYPYAQAPYSTEIGFSYLTRNFEGAFGGDLLTRTLNARKAHILNEPLSEHSLLLGEDARAAGAWGEPEAWGCWLCEGGGEIVVSLRPDDSRFYYIFLRIRTTQLTAQSRVRIGVNGSPAWDDAIGEASRTLVLRAAKPSGASPSGWRLRLQASMDLYDDVRFRLAEIDGRLPTIGFERLAVIPENDLLARVDAMTRMLLEKA